MKFIFLPFKTFNNSLKDFQEKCLNKLKLLIVKSLIDDLFLLSKTYSVDLTFFIQNMQVTYFFKCNYEGFAEKASILRRLFYNSVDILTYIIGT